MAISVRLPHRVEQKLADYCVSHKLTKSQAVKQALERLLDSDERAPSPYELGAEIFARHEQVAPSEDIARHSKRLLRERVKAKPR
jgi:hypothetical protein